MSVDDNSYPGLVDVVRDNRLRIEEGERRITLTGTDFDFEFLDAASAAVNLNSSVAFVLPVSGSNTAVLLSAIILIDDFVRSEELKAQVALATKQMRLRSYYDSLYIGRQKLSNYFPRTVVSKNRVSRIGERPAKFRGKSGRLHFLSELSRISKITGNLNGIVIESQAAEKGDVDQILQRFRGNLPIIYITTNPNDRVLELFKKSDSIWAWNEEQLQNLISNSNKGSALCTEIERLKGATNTEYEVIGPEDENAIDSSLANLWDDLKTIQHYPGGLTFDSVRWVWGIFNVYSQLPTPIELYDQYAKGAWKTSVLTNSSEQAFSFAENAIKKDDREYWTVIADDLQDLYHHIKEANPKTNVLTDEINRLSENNTNAILLVKNRAAKRSTIEFFKKSTDIPFDWTTNIRVSTLNEFRKGEVDGSFDKIILSGPVPNRYSGLLALPTSETLTVLSHGPWQTQRIINQIKRVNDEMDTLSFGEIREKAEDRLDIKAKSDENHEVSINVNLEQTEIRGKRDRDSGQSPTWDPFDVEVVGDLGESDDEVEPPAKTSEEGVEGKVECLRVDLSEGTVFFEPNKTVSKVTKDGDEKVAAKSLKPGQKLLLVEKSVKKDLFDVLTDKLDELPEFSGRTKLIKEWKERAKQGVHNLNYDYEGILNSMEGSNITSVHSIRSWVLGYTHGPQDPKDIKRFGEAVDDEFLMEHWKKIAKALKTMRKHHRDVGRDLSRNISNLSPGEVRKEEYFDRRLGIQYSDLLEAVSVHEIQSISKGLVSVPYQCVNRLLEPRELELLEGVANGKS